MSKRDPNALTDPYAEPAPMSEAPPSSLMPESQLPDSTAPDSAIDSGAPETPAPRRDLPSSPLYSGAQRPISGGLSGVGPEPLPPGEEESPQAVRKRKRRRWRRTRRVLAWTVAALGLAALLGVGGYFGYQRYLAKPKLAVFPQGDAAVLPETVLGVTRLSAKAVRTQYDYEPLDQALWSELAAGVCGGSDLFAALVGSTRWDARRKEVARILAERRQAAKRLVCGKAAAEAFGDARWDIELKDPVRTPGPDEELKRREKKPEKPSDLPPPTPSHQVSLFELSLDRLPEGAAEFIERRERAGLSATRCNSGSMHRYGDCRGGSFAAARIEGTQLWVSGTLDDVESFGHEFSQKAKNNLDQKEVLTRVAAAVEEHPTAMVGAADTFDLGVVRRFGVRTQGLDWSGAEFNVKLISALRSYGAYWGVGDSVSMTQGSFVLVFEPASEADAIDLVLDLKEWRGAAKEALAADGALDLSKEEELKKVDREAIEARHKAGVRSLGEAELERDGKLVTMRLALALEPSEREKIDDYLGEMRERRKTAAKIVDQVMAGDKPDEDLLRELGGRELVELIKHPDGEPRPPPD